MTQAMPSVNGAVFPPVVAGDTMPAVSGEQGFEAILAALLGVAAGQANVQQGGQTAEGVLPVGTAEDFMGTSPCSEGCHLIVGEQLSSAEGDAASTVQSGIVGDDLCGQTPSMAGSSQMVAANVSYVPTGSDTVSLQEPAMVGVSTVPASTGAVVPGVTTPVTGGLPDPGLVPSPVTDTAVAVLGKSTASQTAASQAMIPSQVATPSQPVEPSPTITTSQKVAAPETIITPESAVISGPTAGNAGGGTSQHSTGTSAAGAETSGGSKITPQISGSTISTVANGENVWRWNSGQQPNGGQRVVSSMTDSPVQVANSHSDTGASYVQKGGSALPTGTMFATSGDGASDVGTATTAPARGSPPVESLTGTQQPPVGTDQFITAGGATSTVPSALGSTGTVTLEPTQVVQQVVRHLEQLREHPGQQVKVEIAIDPPQLGPVTVKLALVRGELTAHFFTPDGAVRDAIQAVLPQLREQLAQHQLQLGQAQVFLGHGDTSSGRGYNAWGQEPRFNWVGGESFNVPDADRPSDVAVSSGKLDYLV